MGAQRTKRDKKTAFLERLGHKRGTKLYLIIEKKRVINHHEMQISLWGIYVHIVSFQVCC